MTDLLSHDARLAKLTALSPRAKQRLESESYRISLETDEVDDRAVVETLLCDLVQDLFDIGVELHCPLGELYESFWRVDQLIAWAAYMLPQPLYQLLQSRPELRRLLDSILSGDLDSGASTGVVYLHSLGLDPDALVPELEEVCHFLVGVLVTTGEFDRYLRNLLQLGAAGSLLPPLELARQQDYLARVATLDQRMQAGVQKLQQSCGYLPGLDRLDRRRRFYIQRLTQADQLNRLSWTLADQASLTGASVEEASLRARLYQDFAAGERLHLEHYLTKAAPFDETALIGVLLRLAAATPDRDQLRTAALALPERCITAGLDFTAKHKAILSVVLTTLTGLAPTTP